MRAMIFIAAILLAIIMYKFARKRYSRKKLLARARNIASLALLLCLGLCMSLLPANGWAAADIVQPSGEYASDYANILSSQTEQTINEASAALEQQGKGAQIIVVTLESLDGMEIQDYALEIMRQWGVGDKDEDNGVLLLVSMDPRNVWIMPGYGLEGALNDAKCGRILDEYAVPFMRENDFDQGITGAYTALFNEVCAEYDLDPAEVSSGVIERQISEDRSGLASMILVFIMIVVIALYFRRRGGRGGPGNRSGSGMWPLIMYGMGHHRGRSRGINHRGGGSSGGGWGGGGGGGGFGGGGGSAGGGGAGRGF